jgi:PAS domain S-box-containing protein
VAKTNTTPVRFTEGQADILKRVANACGVNTQDVARWAVDALGDYWSHHGERLLLPLRFHETFYVYQAGPPRLPAPPKTLRAVVVTDAKGLILDVDPAFTEMCGYSLEELRGKKPGDILQGPATEQEIVEQFREALRNQAPFECEITNYRKGGSNREDRSTYRVHIKCEPIFNKGRLVQYRAVETLVSAEPPKTLTGPKKK